MIVRALENEDAEGASRVLVASITELCSADHGGDPERIARWTANKTPENLRRWGVSADGGVLIAEIQGRIAGVGGFAWGGTVQLIYVDPAHRFQGVSRALLVEVERLLRGRGVGTARLDSTATALRFYRSCGWRASGPPDTRFTITGFPMTKNLR